MSDSKAAAAYQPLPAPEPAHDGECSSLYGRALGRDDACDCAPVTQPDLDALIAKLHHHADLATGGTQRSSLFREAANALAAERARADQAREWLRDNETWVPDFEALRTILAGQEAD